MAIFYIRNNSFLIEGNTFILIAYLLSVNNVLFIGSKELIATKYVTKKYYDKIYIYDKSGMISEICLIYTKLASVLYCRLKEFEVI